MNACMYVCNMYVCMFVLQSARHSARRSLIGALIGALCAVDAQLNMYVLRMYVYTDSPIILGLLYMYECMHICMYYVCMRLCTPIGASFRAPIANRRADRRAVWCR